LRTTLPEGFQRSDFLVAHGMVDAIVPRSELRTTLGTLLGHLGGSSA
jgi:acetyl-CoA carboxylase carboxyl transferase subunit beta